MFRKPRIDATTSICIAVSAIFIFSAGLVLASGQSAENTDDATEVLCIPTGTIPLPPPEGVKQKRATVDFPHGVHFGYSCLDCHHKWPGDNQNLTCGTAGCHDIIESPIKTGNKAEAHRYYKNAFHDKCIGCHKEIKIANEKLADSKETLDEELPSTGPTGCVACHPKE